MAEQTLPIDPKLYRETLGRLNLRAVRLQELTTKCHNPVAGNASINISTDAGSRQENSELLVDARYRVKASNEEHELFSIEANFVVVLDAPDELPDGFIEVYIANNVNLTVFPYVRELVASLTGRMGLPALTLPYIINPYEKSPDEKTPTKPKTRPKKKKAAE